MGFMLTAWAQSNTLSYTTEYDDDGNTLFSLSYDSTCEDSDGDGISDGWQGGDSLIIQDVLYDGIEVGQNFAFSLIGQADFSGSLTVYIGGIDVSTTVWKQLSNTKSVTVESGKQFTLSGYVTVDAENPGTASPVLVLVAEKDETTGSSSAVFSQDAIAFTMEQFELSVFDSGDPIVVPLPTLTIEYGSEVPRINLSDYFISETPMTYTLHNEEAQVDNAVADFILMDSQLGIIQYGIGEARAFIYAMVDPDDYEAGTAEGFLYVRIIEPADYVEPECNMEITETVTDESCEGARDGSIVIEVSGGVEPYTYKWNTNRTSNGIYNMSEGDYSVIVMDSVGCTLKRNIWISTYSFNFDSADITPTTCGEKDGGIALKSWYGSYTYLWEDGSTESYRENIGAGTYSVDITNENGCVQHQEFVISDSDAPKINLLEKTNSECKKAEGALSVEVSGGVEPYTYAWNGSSQVDANLVNVEPGIYTLEVVDAQSCKAYFQEEIQSKSFNMQPEVASVTIGEESHNVLVVWQKEKTDYIDFYTIYREQNDNPGHFDTLATVPYNTISVYADEIVDPMQDSWRYKISATDFCSNESPMGYGENKSIHLAFTISEGAINLNWDAYEGKNFDCYSIYKITSQGKVEVAKVPANVTRYTEVIEKGTKGYCVGVNFINPIDVTQYLKAESGPFSIAISNIAEVENDGVCSVASVASVSVQQNVIVVNNKHNASVSVYDILGRVVATDTSRSEMVYVTMNKPGVYVVVVGNEAFKVMVK